MAQDSTAENPSTSDFTATVIPAVCDRHCSVCEGMDHHWMPECDDDDPEPRMICKHCDAVREMTDEDDDLL